jgi:hypothetical protein
MLDTVPFGTHADTSTDYSPNIAVIHSAVVTIVPAGKAVRS